MNIRKNVVMKPWRFALHFADGRTEETTVQARDFPSAILSLPRFCEVGKYNYTLLKGR